MLKYHPNIDTTLLTTHLKAGANVEKSRMQDCQRDQICENERMRVSEVEDSFPSILLTLE